MGHQLNRTEKGNSAARVMHETAFESHRGAARCKPWDTKTTWCVVLYGNDGYTENEDPDRKAFVRSYVHGLYAGFSNMLTEGAVEFGLTEDGYTWAIVLHLPKGNHTRGHCKAVRGFLSDMVWGAWSSYLPFTK